MFCIRKQKTRLITLVWALLCCSAGCYDPMVFEQGSPSRAADVDESIDTQGNVNRSPDSDMRQFSGSEYGKQALGNGVETGLSGTQLVPFHGSNSPGSADNETWPDARLTLTVRLATTQNTDMPHFWIFFPAMSAGSENYNQVIWNLTYSDGVCSTVDCAQGGPNCCQAPITGTADYVYEAYFVGGTPGEIPFVEHPDQWDNFYLQAISVTEAQIESIKINYNIAPALHFEFNKSYSFVNNGDGPGWNDPANIADRIRLVDAGNSEDLIEFEQLTGFIRIHVAEHVKRKRELEMEAVVEDALMAKYGHPVVDIDFDSLPLNIRQAAYDFGQTGREKYTNGNGGACNITQGYYQLMYTEDWTLDFPQNVSGGELFGHDADRFWVRGTPWPIPTINNINLWADAWASGSDRKLARVNFFLNANTRVDLAAEPFVEVHQNPVTGDWINTFDGGAPVPYTPKEGDMFFRWDYCAPIAVLGYYALNHAMTLVSEPYFDSNGDFVMSMFDGPDRSMARNFNESAILKRQIPREVMDFTNHYVDMPAGSECASMEGCWFDNDSDMQVDMPAEVADFTDPDCPGGAAGRNLAGCWVDMDSDSSLTRDEVHPFIDLTHPCPTMDGCWIDRDTDSTPDTDSDTDPNNDEIVPLPHPDCTTGGAVHPQLAGCWNDLNRNGDFDANEQVSRVSTPVSWVGETTVYPYIFPDQGSVVYCPTGSYFRNDYFIGETKHPKEWFVTTPAAQARPWKALSENVLGAPVEDALRMDPTVPNGSDNTRPAREDLRFADFDGDGLDDVFWEKRIGSGASSTKQWLISFSGEGYDGWTPVGNTGAPYRLYFGDFGSSPTSTTGDTHDDIFQMSQLSDGIHFQVKYFDSASKTFGDWKLRTVVPDLVHDLTWYYERTKVVDMHGDTLADVFVQRDDGNWYLYHGAQVEEVIRVGNNDIMDMSRYAFVDINADGFIEVLRLLTNGITGTTRWQVSRATQTGWGPWTDIFTDESNERWYQIDSDNDDLRFGYFNEDHVMDVLLRTPDNRWLVLYDFDMNNQWRPLSVDIPSETPLSDLVIGNFLEEDGAFLRSEIFMYREGGVIDQYRLPAAPLVLPAAMMNPTTGEPAELEGSWNIWSNGYISTTHDFEDGLAEVTVIARGDAALGEWPHMVVNIGETVYDTVVDSEQWTEYTFRVDYEQLSQTEVRVAFDNDYYQGGEDRNLIVHNVVLKSRQPDHDCSDGVKSGDETGIDCGGALCDGCAIGAPCVTDGDCESLTCEGNLCVPMPTCDDDTRNGSETDEDCGGTICPGCAIGQDCLVNSDCQSSYCSDGVCQNPGGDGILAEFEVTTDWGTGYCVMLLITNNGTAPTSDWLVSYNLNGATTYTQWNADFSGNTGAVTATPLYWNNVIGVGETNTSIGFCANRNGSTGTATITDASATY